MTTATEPRQHWLATTPEDVEAMMRAAQIADWHALAEIEENGLRVAPWTYDVSPMLDTREHAPAFVDMNKACIDHALWRRLAVRMSSMGPLVLRIVKTNLDA